MTTPKQNSVDVTPFNAALLGVGKYVATGVKWGGALGTSVTLDFSFHHSGYSQYYGPSGASWYSFYDEYLSASELSAGEKASVRAALATWSSFANVNFREVTDSSTVTGDLRFGYTTQGGPNEAAHAYYPEQDRPYSGDVWFNRWNFNSSKSATIAKGSYDFLAILHEIGHALGLKHTFDYSFDGSPNNPPAGQDNYLYSIMSYTASPWSAPGDNWASFYPTTPMYYDLVAIEGMYGRTAYNAGNNTYIFNDGVKYWQAIQDTGGIDNIVYNGAENATISLNPGTFSALSEAIQFWKSSGGYTSTKSTVTIGPGVVIENAQGGNGNDTLTGNSVANNLNGGAGNDVLTGAAGNDVLIGGAGADTMFGGADNDVYYVDNAGDIVNETGGNGTDTVVSTISFSLTNTARVVSAVENLTLGGSAAVSGIGNALNNTIIGNAAANTLDGGAGNDVLNGGAGADRMFGRAGNDVYYVDNAADIVDETAGNGTDTVVSTISFSLANTARVIGAVENLTLGGSAAINGFGNALANAIAGNAAANTLNGDAGNDVLNGAAGNDVVIGGAGADTMFGGAGNDVYYVDNASDIVNETGGSGIDNVVSTISFSLANTARIIGAVENLTLGGASAISGTGNALDNAIAGNTAANTLSGGAGNDVLNGLAGADTMFGGTGNDVYYVDNTGDIVNETGGDGVDTVVSTISFSLANTARIIGAVENLTLGGSAAISGTGNSLGNIIIGNAAGNVINGGDGDDRLYGGLGNDTLYGGAGNDIFHFNTAPSASNSDTIADFANATNNDDTIWLASAIFTKLGAGAAHALSDTFFWVGDVAQDADDYIVYNQTTGALFYDSNGSEAGGAVQIAALTNKSVLTASDFLVV